MCAALTCLQNVLPTTLTCRRSSESRSSPADYQFKYMNGTYCHKLWGVAHCRWIWSGHWVFKITDTFVSLAKVILKYRILNRSTRTCCLALTLAVFHNIQVENCWLLYGWRLFAPAGHRPRSPAVTADTCPRCCELLYILSPVILLVGVLNPLPLKYICSAKLEHHNWPTRLYALNCFF